MSTPPRPTFGASEEILAELRDLRVKVSELDAYLRQPKTVGVKELASLLGVSERTIYRKVRENAIPYLQAGPKSPLRFYPDLVKQVFYTTTTTVNS